MSILGNLVSWVRGLAFGTVPLTPIPEPENEDDRRLHDAGVAAVADALRLHKLNIIDPSPRDKSENANRCRALIEDMITSPHGLAWTEHEYRGNGAGAEWCAAFWTRCWGARLAFTAKERAAYFASTYRLMELFAGRSIFGVPCPVRPGRQAWKFSPTATALPDGCEPQPGDCLIVGDGDPKPGDHVAMVRGWDAAKRVFLTIEGNAGFTRNGKRLQGVITTTRPLGRREGVNYAAMYLYRMSPLDLTTA